MSATSAESQGSPSLPQFFLPSGEDSAPQSPESLSSIIADGRCLSQVDADTEAMFLYTGDEVGCEGEECVPEVQCQRSASLSILHEDEEGEGSSFPEDWHTGGRRGGLAGGERVTRIRSMPATGSMEEGTLPSAGGGGTTGTLSYMVRRRLQSGKRRHYRRLVFKNGECNISHVNIKKRKRRFLADIFTTLIDIKWRYTLLLFMCAFISSWLSFGIVWWLICFAHDDFAERLAGSSATSEWKPCVDKVVDFPTALLFSIETQHTIGYGYRVITAECPEAILLMMFQSCFGVIIQALLTGLVFAKLSRPKKRAETLMFSKNAVICKRDGAMTLLFRVGDMRKSHIIEAHIRGSMIKKRLTSEGEVLPMEQYDINFGFDEGRDRLFLVWPVIIEHKIDESSPFWDFSAADLRREQFEFIVILEGIVESTGMTTQARSSYLPNEILWGHRFEKLITYQKDNGEYQLDYEKFHCVKRIPHFPECSARELADIGEENMSARGLIHDDDVSLASKSITYNSVMGNNLLSCVGGGGGGGGSGSKGNGSIQSFPLKRSVLNMAHSAAMVSIAHGGGGVVTGGERGGAIDTETGGVCPRAIDTETGGGCPTSEGEENGGGEEGVTSWCGGEQTGSMVARQRVTC